MFLAIVSLIFFLAVVQGFVRVVMYFWDWLSQGEKLGHHEVSRAEQALEGSEDVLERELARAQNARGLGRVFARWRASKEAVNEYLERMHLGWYQVIIIFFVGCMAGLLLEEIWMLLTAGLTENRVGLVWGPFSPLYGTGAVLLTALCFQLRRHGAGSLQIFLASACIGGGLEQLTGWAMETLFNATSWTYEFLPDHITKWVAWRFLFFWGILGLVWARVVMPRLLYQIGMPTSKRQVLFVTLVAVYLVADIGMTLACFNRKTERDAGVPASNAFERWVDTNYTDEFISSRFQNMVIESQGNQEPQSASAEASE